MPIRPFRALFLWQNREKTPKFEPFKNEGIHEAIPRNVRTVIGSRHVIHDRDTLSTDRVGKGVWHVNHASEGGYSSSALALNGLDPGNRRSSRRIVKACVRIRRLIGAIQPRQEPCGAHRNG